MAIKFRIRRRAEAHVAGNIFRRDHLQHAQTIFAVRDEREFRGVDRADLHGARVVERAIGSVEPFELRLFGIGDVDERQAVLAVGHVSVSAREIKPLRVFQRHEAPGINFGFVGSVMSTTLKPSSSVTKA